MMRSLRCSSPVLLTLLLLSAALSSNAAWNKGNDDVCGVWLAQSTIPGAGLGMYAGKLYNIWQPIGPPDIVIPVVDYYYHNPDYENESFFDRYGWTTDNYAHADVEGVSSVGMVPGAGAALNCLKPLVNTIGMDNWVKFSSEGLHRSKDPGVGGFTPFFNRQLLARTIVLAGDELFDSYGEAYFADREHIYGKIPLNRNDHVVADEFLANYVAMKDGLCSDSSVRCTDGTDTNSNVLHQEFYGLITKLSSVWPSRALNALPKDPDHVEEIAEVGTVYTDYHRSQRSLVWLNENGACMDNIVVGTSSIEQAGRGAFAKRAIPKGSLVGPAPALHVKRDFLGMYPTYFNEDGELVADTSGSPVHAQLYLNYCFGHPQSSILVCPYGAVTSLINHSKEKANAKIEWNHKMMQHPEWLEKPIEEWVEDTHGGLMINFVATKDIEPGEEVLIDYGEEWEAAWKQHVVTWKPPTRASKYVPASEMNELEVIRTVAEGHHDEESVTLGCHDIYRIWSGLPANEGGSQKYYCRALYRYGQDGEAHYTAEIYSIIEEGHFSYAQIDEVLFNVPRDAFVFQDRLYSRDHAQPWSFRHAIGIPDEMMPEAWKDLAN